MSLAGKLELANRLLESEIISTSQQFIEFLNEDLYSNKSAKLLLNLYTYETTGKHPFLAKRIKFAIKNLIKEL